MSFPLAGVCKDCGKVIPQGHTHTFWKPGRCIEAYQSSTPGGLFGFPIHESNIDTPLIEFGPPKLLETGEYSFTATFTPGPGFASLFGNYAGSPEGEDFVREIALPMDLDREFGEHPPRLFHDGP